MTGCGMGWGLGGEMTLGCIWKNLNRLLRHTVRVVARLNEASSALTRACSCRNDFVRKARLFRSSVLASARVMT